MELPIGSIIAVLVAFGLITTDAVINANSLYVDVHVAPSLEDKGYNVEVVQSEMIEEMQRIANIRSMVRAPQIRSSASESISVALAELANLGSTMKDVQALVGYAPPKLTVAIVEEGDQLILKASGYSKSSGPIAVDMPRGDGTVQSMIRRAAREAIRELEPYVVVLDEFNDNLGNPAVLQRIENQLEAEIKDLPPTPVSRERANYQNLLGILDLHQNDIGHAEEHFHLAIESAPEFKVPRLNLAFVHVQDDRYQDAIDVIDPLVEPWYWPQFKNNVLLSTAHIIRGVAHWGLKDHDAALADFSYAASLFPESTEAFVYWGRLLDELGQREEALKKLRQAQQNLTHFENYPEVALLYFWLTEKDKDPLRLRSASPIISLDLGAH